MKKIIIYISLCLICFSSLVQGQTLCNSIKINTGYNHSTNSGFSPGTSSNPVMDPYWRVISMPTTGLNCTMPNYNSGGASYVVNDLPLNPDFINANAISFQSTNSLDCNNPSPYDSIVFETYFCLDQRDRIIINGNVVFDDALCMSLIGPISTPQSYEIPITLNPTLDDSGHDFTGNCNDPLVPRWNRTRTRPSTFFYSGVLSAGTYRIQLKLRNLEGSICSVKLEGTVATGSGNNFLDCSYTSSCWPSLLSIRKLNDINENDSIDSGDTPIENWSFDVLTPDNNYPNLHTDHYGYINISGLPGNGIVTITDLLQPGYNLVTASGATISTGNNLTLNLNGSVLYEVVVLNSKPTVSASTLTITKLIDNNFNGIIDSPGDLPVPNYNFNINIPGQPSFTAITNASGLILINNLPSSGTVTISETQQVGSFFITAAGGSIITPGTVSLNLNGQDNYNVIFLNSKNPPIPPCPCPDTISATGQNVNYFGATYPANSSANVNLLLNGTGNYTEVRVNVLDFQLYAKDDQGNINTTCLQCYNNPQSWASIINGNLGSSGNLPIIPGVVSNYPGYSSSDLTNNPREIVFSSNGAITIHNKPLNFTITLPGASPISCCHLIADVTIKITFRNIDCVECELILSGTVEIKPKGDSQKFKKVNGQIMQKTPSVNNYGINDEGLK